MNVAEQLAEVRRGLEDAEANIVKFADSVSEETWTRRTRGGGWSPAECIAHLTMTTDSYLKLLRAAQSRVPAGAGRPSRYRRELGARVLEWFLEPPYRSRAKTIAEFVPNARAPKQETMAAFLRSQQELLAWLKTAESAPLDRMTIASPFNARLRYNAYSALRVMAAHQRRHLWQAERAVKEMA